MNRKLLALAITAALTAPFAAQAAPTVYGQLNLSVDLVDWDDGTNDGRDFEVNSNSSRLGVKGEEALTNGYSAVYKAEWAVSGDVAGQNDLKGRDRYLGLKSGWGTVKLGAYDSPLKTSQGMVDQFNDMNYTDMANFVTGDNRLNNVIGYESPKIADVLSVNVAVQSGEGIEDRNGEPGDDDGVSVSVVFDSNGLYLAAAMDNDIVDGNVSLMAEAIYEELNVVFPGLFPYPGDESFARDTIRLTGGYTMDALQLGAMIQTSEFSNEDASGFDMDEESILLSAAYTMGKNVFKGQYVMSNYDSSDFDTEIDSTALIIGMDHNFTQMTKVYAQLGMSTTEMDGVDDIDANVLTVGMQTKF